MDRSVGRPMLLEKILACAAEREEAISWGGCQAEDLTSVRADLVLEGGVALTQYENIELHAVMVHTATPIHHVASDVVKAIHYLENATILFHLRAYISVLFSVE